MFKNLKFEYFHGDEPFCESFIIIIFIYSLMGGLNNLMHRCKAPYAECEL